MGIDASYFAERGKMRMTVLLTSEKETTSSLERDFTPLITLFKNFGESSYSGHVKHTFKTNGDGEFFEDIVVLTSSTHAFTITEFFNSTQESSNYLVEVAEEENLKKRISFNDAEKATSYIKGFMGSYDNKKVATESKKKYCIEQLVKECVHIALKEPVAKYSLVNPTSEYGTDVTAYRGLNVIYSLCLHDNAFLDVKDLGGLEYELAIYVDGIEKEKIICRAISIMKKARQIFENYIRERSL